MAKEVDRDRINAFRADYEATVGPIRDFGHYASGCPVCGAGEFGFLYCTGHRRLIDAPRDACPIEGRHLHVFCQRCKFEHLSRTRDDAANPFTKPPSHLLDTFARAALAACLANTGGERTIDFAEIKRLQDENTAVYAKVDGSLVTLTLEP